MKVSSALKDKGELSERLSSALEHVRKTVASDLEAGGGVLHELIFGSRNWLVTIRFLEFVTRQL